VSEWSKPIEDFLNERMMKIRIEDVAANYNTEKALGKSLVIDYEEIARFNPQLADYFIKYPDEIFACLNETASKIASAAKKTAINVRLRNLPKEYSTTVQQLGAIHLGILTQFDCVVTLTSDRLAQMEQSTHTCVFCGKVVERKKTKTSSIKMDEQCECGHNSWVLNENLCRFIDVQKAQCQELVEKLSNPMQTPTMDLWFSDDLTNHAVPGEKVKIIGVLKTRPKEREKNVFVRFVDVVGVEHLQQDVEDITFTKEEVEEIEKFAKREHRDDILEDSFAPHISGMGMQKKALILQQLGGTTATNEFKREQINILMIGDPGMAKSELARYNMLIAPKAIRTSGGGSSGVGLTASMERSNEFGGWVVKAGAAVLANNGIVIVDEFDKMSDVDQGLMHEVMADQQVSIAKAGKTLTFQAKTGVLAICNPKFGRFDVTQPAGGQFNISEALRQRFDLIFVLIDKSTKEQDYETTEHISRAFTNESDPIKTEIISPEKMKKYIAYAKQNYKPVLKNSEVLESAREWFVGLREKCKNANIPPMPYRFFESLVRLAGAFARRRLSNVVEKGDVLNAQELLKYSLDQYLIDPKTGNVDTTLDEGQGKLTKNGKSRTMVFHQAAQAICKEHPNGISERDLKRQIMEQTGMEEQQCWDVYAFARSQGILKFLNNGLLVYKDNMR